MKFCNSRNPGTIASILSLSMGLTLTSLSAYATAGGSDRGGGDLCEDRIQEIARDLKSWIERGGPSSLTLTSETSVTQYSEAMLKSIAQAKIRCVKPGDEGYPIVVHGAPKVCKFEKIGSLSLIQCDYNSFLDKQRMSESDQYTLIHHEYAGNAGLEKPDLDVSGYSISNQISDYLQDQVVKKLAIKLQRPSHSGLPTKFERVRRLYEQASEPATIADINQSGKTQECHLISSQSPDYIEPAVYYFKAVRHDFPGNSDPIFPQAPSTKWYFVFLKETQQWSDQLLDLDQPKYPQIIGHDFVFTIPQGTISSIYPCRDERGEECVIPEMNFRIRRNQNLLLFQMSFGELPVVGYCSSK